MNADLKAIAPAHRKDLTKDVLAGGLGVSDLDATSTAVAQSIDIWQRDHLNGREQAYTIEELSSKLDGLASKFEDGDVFSSMAALRDTLLATKSKLPKETWLEAVEMAGKHPIGNIVRQCPITNRSFHKPRGYAGDARLIDYSYGTDCEGIVPHPAELGGQIAFFVAHSPACWAVRKRRELIADQIAKIAASKDDSRILSIACGHLRELDLLSREQTASIKEFIALDQDDASLSIAGDAGHDVPITTISRDIRALIRNRLSFENLDFVYASGLYDYLSGPIGTRLIEKGFSYLAPGGKLMIGNFTPYGPDIGYMEACMGWPLVYRSFDEFKSLFSTLPKNEVANIEVFADDKNVIAYVIVEKQ